MKSNTPIPNGIIQQNDQNLIKDQFNQNFLPRFDNDFAENYYDLIICANSLCELTQGWKFKYTENGNIQYLNQKDKRSCVVGIVGNANKGKSFILHLLADISLPTGYSVATEGLSVKYPVIQNKNIVLLDTAGLETPLKKNSSVKESKDKMEHLIARDRQLTELFLQNFVISQSNILIAVVNNMTYSDQKLLNRIKRDSQDKKKKLFVIHNLQSFVEISQVKSYIKETLFESLTFELITDTMTNFDSKEGNKSQNMEYFSEVNKIEGQNIIHLIMANDKSEAGEYYNGMTISFLQKQCESFTDIAPFPVVERVRDHLYSLSKELMDNPILDKNSIELTYEMIKVNNRESIVLKKCFVDELGFSNLYGNSFIPKHSYYINKDEFILEIEISGNVKNFKSKIDIIEEWYVLKVTGTKENTTENNSIFTSRENGPFQIELTLKLSEFLFTDCKIHKFERKDGIITLYYKLKIQDANDNIEDIIDFN